MGLEDHHQGQWSVLPGEVHVHHGGPHHRPAATRGEKGDSSPPHEDCDPVCRHLPPPHRIHNEHPPEAHCQAGQLLHLIKYFKNSVGKCQ